MEPDEPDEPVSNTDKSDSDNSDNPARSPDKQLVSSRPDVSPDLAKTNGLPRTHVSSLSNGSNGDAEYLEQRR